MLDEKSVLGKVEVILDVLAADGGRVGLSQLSKRSNVSKSTVHRICIDLIEWGVVERSGDGFRLGSRLFELGARVPERRRLRDTALPFLEELLVASCHTVHLAVLSGDRVFYVDKLVVRSSTPTPFSVASHVPLHASATGKAMLAFGDKDLVFDTLARPLEQITPHTVTSPVALAAELREIADRGYSVERNELVEGYASAAAPILGYRDQLIGAVSVASTIDALSVQRVAGALCTTAAAIGRSLGGAALSPVRSQVA